MRTLLVSERRRNSAVRSVPTALQVQPNPAEADLVGASTKVGIENRARKEMGVAGLNGC